MPILSRFPVHETISVVIDGEELVGDPEQVGDFVIAERNSDGHRYARLHRESASYLWTGDLSDVNENTSGDPLTELRWERE